MKREQLIQAIKEVLKEMTEGEHNPVKPGILKDRLGNLTCTKVKAAKAGLR